MKYFFARSITFQQVGQILLILVCGRTFFAYSIKVSNFRQKAPRMFNQHNSMPVLAWKFSMTIHRERVYAENNWEESIQMHRENSLLFQTVAPNN